MEDREISAHVKRLVKATTSDAEPEVLKLLDELKHMPAPTEDQLRSTKVGITVGKLRSNSNKEIARSAAELVGKWKKHVDAIKEAKRQQQRAMGASSATSAPKSSKSPIVMSSGIPSGGGGAAASGRPYEGDTEKRHFKTDKVDTSRTGDPTRDNIIGLLYNGLAFRRNEPIEEVLRHATACEAAAHRHFDGTTQAYRTRMRALFSALKRKDNRQLGERLFRGRLSAAKFVALTDAELASDEQRAKDEALEKENMKKAQVAMPEKSISDALKCGKCGQKKVSYSQAQTRSADEPMTTFCECTVCGNRWKFS